MALQCWLDGWHMSSHALALGFVGAGLRLPHDGWPKTAASASALEDRSAGRLHQRGVVGAGGSADAVPGRHRGDAPSPIHYNGHRHRYEGWLSNLLCAAACAAAATTIITVCTTMTIIMTQPAFRLCPSSPTPPLRCWRSSHCSAVSFGAPLIPDGHRRRDDGGRLPSLMRDSGKIFAGCRNGRSRCTRDSSNSGHCRPLAHADRFAFRPHRQRKVSLRHRLEQHRSRPHRRSVRQLLAAHPELVHVTVEINRLPLAQGIVLFKKI